MTGAGVDREGRILLYNPLDCGLALSNKRDESGA